jgi:purine-cytosine permease-like protein
VFINKENFIFFFLYFFLEIGKILFVENLFVAKRRERLHIGECRGTRKPVIPRKILKATYLTGESKIN